MMNLVARNGMGIQGVIGRTEETSWAYTIGRVLVGLPELVVVGMPVRQCADLLNHVTLAWDRVIEGEFAEVVSLLPVPRRVWAMTDWVAGAHRLAGERGIEAELEVMQVVWADDGGRFPWDPDSDRSLRRVQPLLALTP